MFLSKKSFCKTKTLVLVKTNRKIIFFCCDKNATDPYILPVTQNMAVHSRVWICEYFFCRVIQWKPSLTKYCNQLSAKPALLDRITKLDFQHCQVQKNPPNISICVCLYLLLLQMQPSVIPASLPVFPEKQIIISKILGNHPGVVGQKESMSREKSQTRLLLFLIPLVEKFRL